MSLISDPKGVFLNTQKTGGVLRFFLFLFYVTYKGLIPTLTCWSVCPGLLYGREMQFMLTHHWV